MAHALLRLLSGGEDAEEQDAMTSVRARPLDERVASLETNVASVARAVDQLAHSIESGFRDTKREREEFHAEHRTEIGRLREALQRTSQTNWGPIWTAVGVAVALILGVFTIWKGGYERDQDRVSIRIDALASDVSADRRETVDRLVSAAHERGRHDEKLSALERDIDAARVERARQIAELDSKIQNEQSLAGARTEALVAATDAKIQLEIAAVRDVQAKEVEWLKDRLAQLIESYRSLSADIAAMRERQARLESRP